MNIERFPVNPIVTPELHPSLGTNINGPSMVVVPPWVRQPLGKYYLYFAHHHGKHIRMAYADHLDGPWTVHGPGALQLEDSTCLDHIASPDVHVDEENQQIRMYFHGIAFPDRDATDGHERLFGESSRWVSDQRTKVAVSTDGIHFQARPEILGSSYFRTFQYGGYTYALAMPGVFYRSRDGLSNFEMGPICFGPHFRHCAVLLREHVLHVFHSNVGDAPERILHTTIDLRPNWTDWRTTPVTTLAQPEMDYEGVNRPLLASVRGAVYEPVHELRDPAIFQEDGQLFLLYAVAGESGIAIARLDM